MGAVSALSRTFTVLPCLVGPLVVWAVAFEGLSVAGALGLTALDHASQYGAFGEVLDPCQFRFQFLKALGVRIGSRW
jgi:hypothetical protein